MSLGGCVRAVGEFTLVQAALYLAALVRGLAPGDIGKRPATPSVNHPLFRRFESAQWPRWAYAWTNQWAAADGKLAGCPVVK